MRGVEMQSDGMRVRWDCDEVVVGCDPEDCDSKRGGDLLSRVGKGLVNSKRHRSSRSGRPVRATK